MGIVGRNIDSGTDVQRDRVIEALNWDWDFVKEDGCRCLLGHMEAWSIDEGGYKIRDEIVEGRHETISGGDFGYNVFVSLLERFGKDRIVRACKMRAAKGNHELVEKIRAGSFVPTATTLTLAR